MILTWLKPDVAARLVNKSERTIRRNAENGKYGKLGVGYRHVKGVGGNSGNNLEIALESLTADAQAKHKGQLPPENPQSDLLEYSAKMRDMANWRAYIVDEYRYSGLSPAAFVERHNRDNPDDTITTYQLFRWQNKQNRADGDIEALIDRRGIHNRGNTSITFEQWDFFEDLYLRQQKLSIQRCWELTQITFAEIPSVSAFERQVKKIPKLKIILNREGPKAYNDALPHIRFCESAEVPDFNKYG